MLDKHKKKKNGRGVFNSHFEIKNPYWITTAEFFFFFFLCGFVIIDQDATLWYIKWTLIYMHD